MGFVARRELARGEKTAEDQGVPWMKTRVCWGVFGVALIELEERRVYLMFQLSWWKVDGRGIASGLVESVIVTTCLFVEALATVENC